MAATESTSYVDKLAQLTLEEKIALLSGCDFSTANGVERLGIPKVRVSDSICGIRPSGISGDMTTACFPNTVCYGATWDAELMGRLGEQLAHQARLKNSQVVLGPTINMHRDPRAGRNFECFSEDPLLSGQLAGAIVNGVRRGGVASCPKHFVCNDAETLRHFYDVNEGVDSRTLREIYLAAWQHLLRTSEPDGIMMAYNKVDGKYCSAHDDLISRILRREWGFRGITMSDWFGTKDVVGPVKAGLDLEMPFPVFRGKRLVTAVEAGEVTKGEIDALARRMLELRDRTRECQSSGGPERSEISDEANQLARDIAAGGMVLLKNDNCALPLNVAGVKPKIVLVGEFAKDAVFTGGGSASCTPQYKRSPLDILQEEYRDQPDALRYASGVRTRRYIPEAPTHLLQARNGQPGVDIAFYNNDDSSGKPHLEEHQERPSVWMLGEFKPGLKVPGSRVQISTRLTPDTTGEHTMAVRCTGSFSLTVDEEEVLSGPEVEISTEQFIFNHILLERLTTVSMTAGQSYKVVLTMQGPSKLVAGEPTPYAACLGFERAYSEDAAIEEAAALARDGDVSVVYAGRNEQYESEGFDLPDIRMPENQTRLIRAVAAASAKTILVLHCGNPINVGAVVDEVDAILLAHFPGQEGARAALDILTGKTSPMTIEYAEGIKMGYRAPVEPQRIRWPFGHGLSYTSFQYTDLQVVKDDGSGAGSLRLKCSIRIQNTGMRAGMEVVQMYVTPPESSSNNNCVWRPERELKAFTKVTLGAGESRSVEIEADMKVACSYWEEETTSWRLQAGTYGVLVGGLTAKFEVEKGCSWNHL
ncbi:hypothetical protein PG999_010499 [Apiospora kogelbergensis]|uniref:beta-glucosidase n=1 Tax=Apiospora kogelbergensis TaxID=1337665 RepID=A0AAW0QAB3_9PEZI